MSAAVEAPTYTEAEVSEAANAAMSLITDEIEVDDDMEDLLSLLVNATVTVLASGMKAELEDVVMENYGEDLDEWKETRGL
ncbi:hypothetical protein [Streptomyces sp. NPDC048489]|uniref:hypothetical protein n=1 Tax=Streptomyces sp. NPDC048489 TaxID=3154504 RepID=UPI003428A875